MSKEYILALDEGSYSTKCGLLNRQGILLAQTGRKFAHAYPQTGWHEIDPLELWDRTRQVMDLVMTQAGVEPARIGAVGIANQRGTFLVWEKRTGRPVSPAIFWGDTRGTALVDKYKSLGADELLKEKAGTNLNPYYSGLKLCWLLENVPDLRSRAEKGELLFGTIETWLIWQLSGGRVHVSDYSNAQLTLLFNARTKEWDPELLDLFQVPRSMLPELKSGSEIYGQTDPGLFKGMEIPIAGAAGDQTAALFGHRCHTRGKAKCSYGTSCVPLMFLGDDWKGAETGSVTAVYDLAGRMRYGIGISTAGGGDVLQWLRDDLGLIDDFSQTAELAAQAGERRDVFLVPAFSGLGGPHWDATARGLFIGFGRDTSKQELVRAALESIAFRIADGIEEIILRSGITPTGISVDGGASKNDYLMQFQADILGIAIHRPLWTEVAPLGAGYLAGLAVGFFSPQDLSEPVKADRIFKPRMSKDERQVLYARWLQAVERAKGWTA